MTTTYPTDVLDDCEGCAYGMHSDDHRTYARLMCDGCGRTALEYGTLTHRAASPYGDPATVEAYCLVCHGWADPRVVA